MPIRTTQPLEGVEGTVLYEAIGPDGAPLPGPRVALVGWMHGNEHVGGDVLDRLAEVVAEHLVAGSILGVRANLEARRLDLRHTPDGTDLNRLWGCEALDQLRESDPETLCYEERRALALAPLFQPCDAILDLHSTSRPSPAFLVFRDDQRHARLVARLGVRYLVTGLHEGGILEGCMSPDAGLRPGEGSERIGLTLESGQHTDPRNIERAWRVVLRFLALTGVWDQLPPEPDVEPEVYEVLERFRQAPEGTPPYRFVGYEGGEPGAGRRGPLRRLASFDEVEAGEVLMRRGRETVVRASTPFTMLLPAPSAPPGGDLYYVAQRRLGGVAAGEAPRTHAQARREAEAIERMLDVLADDAFERGSTVASFDGRQILDLCAEQVLRVLRLPRNHPHRCITVMGRGDFGGDEAERRAGQRYRRAMRRALVDGVPIDRMQILRGTGFGFLDGLTSAAMGAMLRKRRERREAEGLSGDAMRLYLSVRQPHTVSILATGDLDLALQQGDLRHVRVALVVEAASVEPDSPMPWVRVVRSGVVSARPEILETTARLLHGLREEHRRLLDKPPLRSVPGIAALVGEDGALVPRGDDALGGVLRPALRRLLLRLWQDALRRYAVPRSLGSDRALGRWLAEAMAATGILDAEGLLALVARKEGTDWVVDPSALERAIARVDALEVPEPTGRPAPRAPLSAGEVDADDLQRWIGWKRYVRAAQSIPDTRGKDVDLALSEEDIQRRLAGWLRRARSMAASRPGDVVVVVAGDGGNPHRDGPNGGAELLAAHRDLLLDPNVRYLRIQHARGTHLSWMKDVLDMLELRPAHGEPVAIQWEPEHGATVNVVLVGVRDREHPAPEGPWSLEGWSIQSCAVVVSDLQSSARGEYKVGIFTEPLQGPDDRVNHELLQFGRAHCQALLSQGGPRVLGGEGRQPAEALRDGVIAQLARWVEQVRRWEEDALAPPPEAPDQRALWVADWLGLADADLAVALAGAMDGAQSSLDAARGIWMQIEPWPGPGWRGRLGGFGPASPLPRA